VVAGFSAYSYVKLANAWPSAGGIAIFLHKAYGKTMMTGVFALLMYFSVLGYSLVPGLTHNCCSAHLQQETS
jgi:amino acid transporter